MDDRRVVHDRLHPSDVREAAAVVAAVWVPVEESEAVPVTVVEPEPWSGARRHGAEEAQSTGTAGGGAGEGGGGGGTGRRWNTRTGSA
jgi:hypothetical protein